MNFFSFTIRSFFLSFAVALFWLPVLAIVFYGIYLLVIAMQTEIIGLVMILVLIYYPLQVLLLVLAVRGGMTILKVTAGSDIPKLLGVTARAMMFNGIFASIIINLFAWATAITGIRLMKPEFISEFYRIRESAGIFQAYYLAELFQDFPIVLALGGTVGTCVAFATFAVNFAAKAATAVDNPPGHDQLWGIAGQFGNLFFLGVLFLVVPHIAMIVMLGGVNATYADLDAANDKLMIIYGAYNLWTICLMAAASALAYKVHLGVSEIRRKRDIEILSGSARPDGPQVDLKALRQARMGGLQVRTDDAYDDDDE